MNSDPTFADYADGTETPMPDWIDDDFVKAVVALGKELPGNVIPFPSRKKGDAYTKMTAMAARTRERRTK